MTQTTEPEKKPRKPKLYRAFPQLKTFSPGTILKNKIDLFYSLEEDELETGSEDGFSPLFNLNGNHSSFAQTDKFIAKDTNLFFVEAAQFKTDSNQIFVRLHLLTGEKAVWINLIKTSNKIWSFLIRAEQKERIKTEIESMFEILAPGEV